MGLGLPHFVVLLGGWRGFALIAFVSRRSRRFSALWVVVGLFDFFCYFLVALHAEILYIYIHIYIFIYRCRRVTFQVLAFSIIITRLVCFSATSGGPQFLWNIKFVLRCPIVNLAVYRWTIFQKKKHWDCRTEKPNITCSIFEFCIFVSKMRCLTRQG